MSTHGHKIGSDHRVNRVPGFLFFVRIGTAHPLTRRRVLPPFLTGFLSSRPNWVRPLPHPQASVAPLFDRLSLQSSELGPPTPSPAAQASVAPLFWFWGAHTRWRERGWADPIQTRGQTLRGGSLDTV
jgi:hypothetical protein